MQHPVEARPQQQHRVRPLQGSGPRRGHEAGRAVGDDALPHGRGEDRDVGHGGQLSDLSLGPGIGGPLAHNDQRLGRVLEDGGDLLEAGGGGGEGRGGGGGRGEKRVE